MLRGVEAYHTLASRLLQVTTMPASFEATAKVVTAHDCESVQVNRRPLVPCLALIGPMFSRPITTLHCIYVLYSTSESNWTSWGHVGLFSSWIRTSTGCSWRSSVEGLLKVFWRSAEGLLTVCGCEELRNWSDNIETCERNNTCYHGHNQKNLRLFIALGRGFHRTWSICLNVWCLLTPTFFRGRFELVTPHPLRTLASNVSMP